MTSKFNVVRLRKKDFILKNEDFSNRRRRKREYLNDQKTHCLIGCLNHYFQSEVAIPRVRMGEQQEIETLINEEAFLFARYLRGEKPKWTPRIAEPKIDR